ncbi:MAG: dTMP kinase [Elusimicrobia bacterium CG08_land_8_20_14_0_20_51_18]|nr:MAG: dTMP kinase [Elusimicrobia bacterium CG08_land_8_20_14_0_20_51_18]
MAAKKGFFIVLEGPDRSGKSTQADLLKEWFENRNKKVLMTREPGGTRLSEEIRKLLLNPKNFITALAELFLYEAARAQHTAEKILPALKRGEIVISDRFTMATVAYQGYGRKIGLEIIKKLNRIATCGLKPDLNIVFTMPDSEFDKRRRTRLGFIKETPDRIEKENNAFRRRVNTAYRKIALKEKNILKIDATGKIGEISSAIRNAIIKKMNPVRFRRTRWKSQI